MKILLLSDIHGNFPALEAIAQHHPLDQFDLICNSGDSTVYCPYPDEVLSWLRKYHVQSIRGNTDDKVIKLLKGKTFKKPRKPEKRIMYTSAVEALSPSNRQYLCTLKKKYTCKHGVHKLCLFHGSPEDHEEFLFQTTPDKRFRELAAVTSCTIVVTGHSHSPYHKHIEGVHFINPGSAGRMFDGNPQACYAVLQLQHRSVQVTHFRCTYDIEAVAERITSLHLPSIYKEMFRTGKKLN
ncbi:metallophosphoesterase family protein [Desulfogranum marinum]|uniref:metallophosphoesterase family protein n=1 Tax=Desulfogranum marinum TaxID=453220 RepID=UPI0019628265|nr:metallophosphoesterase family protein [Desulfogranum marinum]MBM9513127.1 metallophosphoesterase family protein [Desulfogranum marinum]